MSGISSVPKQLRQRFTGQLGRQQGGLESILNECGHGCSFNSLPRCCLREVHLIFMSFSRPSCSGRCGTGSWCLCSALQRDKEGHFLCLRLLIGKRKTLMWGSEDWNLCKICYAELSTDPRSWGVNLPLAGVAASSQEAAFAFSMECFLTEVLIWDFKRSLSIVWRS